VPAFERQPISSLEIDLTELRLGFHRVHSPSFSLRSLRSFAAILSSFCAFAALREIFLRLRLSV
jgi:hypothetical protein